MTTQTVSSAVAKRDDGPRALIGQYRDSFAAVVPSHVKADQWVRLAQGALKKGKVVEVRGPDGGLRKQTELEIAAGNNPGVFLAHLLDAARLGLEPGTEQYYLTPRKVKGKLEILGIVGYQGHIELMYRAGAISSVVAECVYTGDTFRYRPGVDERPVHDIDWDAADRGQLRLVYAYAVMKDGATSKVIVLNRAAINVIKTSSQGASSEFSPWVKHEPSMWLKSAVRQLAKWVPTSAEYRTAIQRAEQATEPTTTPADATVTVDSPADPIDEMVAGQTLGDDYVDAEVIETATPEQRTELDRFISGQQLDDTYVATMLRAFTGHCDSLAALTADDATTVLTHLRALAGQHTGDDLVRALDHLVGELLEQQGVGR
jgi:recombination protein RecT